MSRNIPGTNYKMDVIKRFSLTWKICLSAVMLSLALFHTVSGDMMESIIGGVSADIADYPWQLSMQYLHEGNWIHFCGAVLIDANWALTAAHCVRNREAGAIHLVAGTSDLTSLDTTAQILTVAEIIPHPDFSTYTFVNDIALLRLGTPADVSRDNIGSLAVIQSQNPMFGHQCTVTGWGLTSDKQSNPQLSSTLNKVTLYITKLSVCRAYWEEKGLPVVISTSHTCAWVTETSIQSFCAGDSGGGLVCEKNGQPFLHGLVSFSNDDCLPGKPNVFTSVSRYCKWIRDTTGLQ